jgi:hypothetical protein
MATALTLEIPDRIYRLLQEKAAHLGKAIEQLAIERLGEIAKEEPDDPLLRLAGAFTADTHNIGTDHDLHLGQELRCAHD